MGGTAPPRKPPGPSRPPFGDVTNRPPAGTPQQSTSSTAAGGNTAGPTTGPKPNIPIPVGPNAAKPNTTPSSNPQASMGPSQQPGFPSVAPPPNPASTTAPAPGQAAAPSAQAPPPATGANASEGPPKTAAEALARIQAIDAAFKNMSAADIAAENRAIWGTDEPPWARAEVYDDDADVEYEAKMASARNR